MMNEKNLIRQGIAIEFCLGLVGTASVENAVVVAKDGDPTGNRVAMAGIPLVLK